MSNLTSELPESVSRSTVKLQTRMLMITPAVAPAPVATAFVLENLFSQFSPSELVVAAQRLPTDPPKYKTGPNHIPIHFVNSRWTWPQRGRRFVHWVQWFLFPIVIWRVIRLVRREKCQAIFVNFPEVESLLLAHFAAWWTKLPLYSFFHNTYLENRHGWGRIVANWLQPRIFQRSKIVFVMSTGMRDELIKLWPTIRFEPLTHTNSQPIPEFEPLPAINPQNIKFGLLGSINASNYDALGRLCQYVNEHPETQFCINSNGPSWFLKKMGFVGPRITSATPRDEELLPILRNCDILLLPHGFTGGLTPIEYATIFPTRTIMYLLAGRPIIAHSPPDCFYTNWLREQDCAEVVDEPSLAAIDKAVQRLINNPARCETLVRNALRAVDQFTASRVIGRMKEQINETLAN